MWLDVSDYMQELESHGKPVDAANPILVDVGVGNLGQCGLEVKGACHVCFFKPISSIPGV